MGAVTAPGMRQQWAARTGGEMKLFGRCAIIESCFVTHACIPQALHPSATSHRTTNIVPAKLLCARRLNSIPSKYAPSSDATHHDVDPTLGVVFSSSLDSHRSYGEDTFRVASLTASFPLIEHAEKSAEVNFSGASNLNQII